MSLSLCRNLESCHKVGEWIDNKIHWILVVTCWIQRWTNHITSVIPKPATKYEVFAPTSSCLKLKAKLFWNHNQAASTLQWHCMGKVEALTVDTLSTWDPLTSIRFYTNFYFFWRSTYFDICEFQYNDQWKSRLFYNPKLLHGPPKVEGVDCW